jgi:hypothetical protein
MTQLASLLAAEEKAEKTENNAEELKQANDAGRAELEAVNQPNVKHKKPEWINREDPFNRWLDPEKEVVFPEFPEFHRDDIPCLPFDQFALGYHVARVSAAPDYNDKYLLETQKKKREDRPRRTEPAYLSTTYLGPVTVALRAWTPAGIFQCPNNPSFLQS